VNCNDICEDGRERDMERHSGKPHPANVETKTAIHAKYICNSLQMLQGLKVKCAFLLP